MLQDMTARWTDAYMQVCHKDLLLEESKSVVQASGLLSMQGLLMQHDIYILYREEKFAQLVCQGISRSAHSCILKSDT